MAERIDKLLSSTGRWSRKEAKALLKAGRVTAEGRVLRDPAEKREAEGLYVDGAPLLVREHTWVLLNKPAGYLSARRDGRDKVVTDLLPPELRKLFPVGRLDKDSLGLLLLTDDGPLAHRLLSPRHHVEKEYFVRVQGTLSPADQAAFARGLPLEDGEPCLPADLMILSDSTARVTLREGKYHQVKRMLASLGKPVVFLERVRMGNLTLDSGMKRGEFRFLEEGEVEDLRRVSGLPPKEP